MGETLHAVGGVRDAPSLDEPPERLVGGKLGVGEGLLIVRSVRVRMHPVLSPRYIRAFRLSVFVHVSLRLNFQSKLTCTHK